MMLQLWVGVGAPIFEINVNSAERGIGDYKLIVSIAKEDQDKINVFKLMKIYIILLNSIKSNKMIEILFEIYIYSEI